MPNLLKAVVNENRVLVVVEAPFETGEFDVQGDQSYLARSQSISDDRAGR
jgi:hypothetical protein